MTIRRAQGACLAVMTCTLHLSLLLWQWPSFCACLPPFPPEKQLPLEGLTLDAVALWLDTSWASPGYAYVAASRVRRSTDLWHIGDLRRVSPVHMALVCS